MYKIIYIAAFGIFTIVHEGLYNKIAVIRCDLVSYKYFQLRYNLSCKCLNNINGLL